MMAMCEFDLVVYGATGFTGRLVAEYLASRCRVEAEPRVTWAMAGRSAEKLAQVRDEIGAPANTPLLVVDAVDAAAVRGMVARTRTVLSTVGPYQRYGAELLAACVASGTDYLDLCGEPTWMVQTIDAYHEQAKATGARIVHSCGFDSIPFELGVAHVQEIAQMRLGHAVPRVNGRVRDMRGGISGGSAETGRATVEAVQANPALVGVLADPFALTPGFIGPPQPKGDQPYFDLDIGAEVGPFVMAVVNTKNIHRSNFLLGHPYGRDFVYEEMAVVGPDSPFPTSAFGPNGPRPGDGPCRAEREAGYFDLLFIGIDSDGSQVLGRVHGDMDPGYGSTAKMMAEAAICLAVDSAETLGGVWTPGAAMGPKLRSRLEGFAGLSFSDVTPAGPKD